MLKRKKIKPITLKDVTIIDDGKLKKAITAASLGNAMEWFDFGVYGFVAYALGKVFFPDANPSVQMIAALGTFSVPFLIRPLGGLFFGMLGDKYGRQKILAITIVIMSISTFCIGLIPSYATIGIWAPILLLLCKMAQGFSVGGEYTGASIFVAEYSPDRKRGFMGSWLDFGSIATLEDLSWKTALGIGCFQVLSLVPGTSRSGSTIIGGLLLGCTRSVASKFTFFLAIPVMFGASALKLVKYFIKGGTFGANEVAILGVGCVVAFVVSLIAIKWLMGFVRRHDFKCFGVYRIILGIVVLAYFFVLEPMLGL